MSAWGGVSVVIVSDCHPFSKTRQSGSPSGFRFGTGRPRTGSHASHSFGKPLPDRSGHAHLTLFQYSNHRNFLSFPFEVTPRPVRFAAILDHGFFTELSQGVRNL
ncbi:hypothetical protein CEXT_95711 [Caerostris extrusa]|uniref:Uncharacterized protein n=1 Tax=Caerostris extrusa TaxID=172846 RepID=A0AAV4XF10_CAEEX|nr:hypothetical protein CEXT_95711 [Caerostris extrusa]